MSRKDTIITKTPMRITLGGGGTDVLWYSKLRGGSWISAAINKYVFISVKDASSKLKTANPIIKECLKLTGVSQDIEIIIKSDVPAGSGLGGSGAFEIGLLNALYQFKKEKVTSLKLAEQAVYIEAKKLKKPVGPQDQYIAALGGIKYFEIDKKGEISVESLKLKSEVIKKLENNLLYFITGITRDTEAVLGEQKKQRVIIALDQIKELGLKVKKALLKGDVDEFGKSLHTHWLIKKRLSDKVSNPKIDEWYEYGIKNGALGGKIMGAGGGGWFVFYVNKNHHKFIKKMQGLKLIHKKVKFEFEGTKVVYAS